VSDVHVSIHDPRNPGEPERVSQNEPAPERADGKNIEAGESLLRANARQEGGGHYKQFQIEPWDAIIDWNLGYLDGNAVKYLSRWRHKNGLEDLKKARHYIDKLLEVEQAKKS
jgi:hypothetical protein